jgi:hypothetical protein
MSYRPLADGPQENIALRARRPSQDEDRTLAEELDDDDETLHEIAQELDMYVYYLRITSNLTKSYRSKPFPVDPDAPEELHQFTLRAVVVGCLLGSIGECEEVA